MKKEYKKPTSMVIALCTEPLLNPMSPNSQNPGTNPGSDPYQGEFSAPDYEDEEEDEEDW